MLYLSINTVMILNKRKYFLFLYSIWRKFKISLRKLSVNVFHSRSMHSKDLNTCLQGDPKFKLQKYDISVIKRILLPISRWVQEYHAFHKYAWKLNRVYILICVNTQVLKKSNYAGHGYLLKARSCFHYMQRI